MSIGVVVDTSFLISLVDSTQPFHSVAREYYRAALDSKIVMYLPSLVVAEYERKHSISALSLKTFLPTPFNVPEGKLAAKISNLVNKTKTKDDKERVAVDVMLIALAEMIEGATGVITADTNTLAKFSAESRAAGITKKGVVNICHGFHKLRLANPFHSPIPMPGTPATPVVVVAWPPLV